MTSRTQAPWPATGAALSRRSFVRGATGALGAAAALSAAGCLPAQGLPDPAEPLDPPTPLPVPGDPQAQAGRDTPGDIAVLKFLAAAELVEDDLWQQYCELAVGNPGFRAALSNIDPALIRYICDDRDDERSHANLINGYLASVGEEPVNLDAFRTLPSVNATGSEGRGRLTSLTSLTVDTSWYDRYRGVGNPDFGDSFGQVVSIAGRPTVPTSNSLSAQQLQTIAHSAAFHFCAIEQGGGSLYNHLLSRVSSPNAVAILASIGPTEVYHFAVFHKSLEGLFGHDSGDGLVFPDLASDVNRAQAIFPEPCRFLSSSLPLCSVIRPRSTANAGALAAATGLVSSGLFTGQSSAFLDAVVALATAADSARRS